MGRVSPYDESGFIFIFDNPFPNHHGSLVEFEVLCPDVLYLADAFNEPLDDKWCVVMKSILFDPPVGGQCGPGLSYTKYFKMMFEFS